MGGTGFTMKIERLRPGWGTEPVAFHREIWKAISRLVHKTCTRRGNRVVLADYFGHNAYVGLESEDTSDRWSSSETELDFWFRNPGGCCGCSSIATYHWVDLALSYETSSNDAVAQACGFRIVSRYDPPRALLRTGPRYPLVEAMRTLFCVPRLPAGKLDYDEDSRGLFSDDGNPRPALSELSVEEHAKVLRAALTGLCACQLCEHITKRTTPRKPRVKKGKNGAQSEPSPAPSVGDEGAIPVTWMRLAEDPDATRLATAAGAAIRDFPEESWLPTPLGPPELQVLRDWLEERSLLPPADALIGMVLNFTRLSDR